ncbi:enoyl-CoA hydratase/isomerase family protein [Pseudonocardia xishanensis]|uniref:Enoyl-CoA hydratase/isomerase family protein n=1 Tax=Pseudonocardia xishanensis TaxID=630995 RepID=A0ABP8RS91_9PSEU
MSAPPPPWKNIAVTRHGAVTEALVHTDGGPLVYGATVHREIVELADWLRTDETTRVLVFGGTGDRFCTEIDTDSYRGESWHRIWVEGRRGPAGLLDLDIPMIAAVNGPATYHSELPMLADIVLACPEATFADHAHFTKGIVPGDGVQTVWRNLVGPSRATYHLLTGAELDAAEARRIGVVHEIHPRAELLARAHALAAPMAALPVETLMYTRTALRAPDRRLFSEELSHGLALAGLEMFLTGKRTVSVPEAHEGPR